MAQTKYSIVHVPHTEEGIQEYIKPCKDFRLLSLQLAPEAFSSTYEREIAFTDEVWYGRLSHPGANSFVAVIEDSGQIVSTTTLLGPLSYGPDVLAPLGNPWKAIDNQSGRPAVDETEPLHFRVNAVFTLPEARRLGLSKALIERVLSFAEAQQPPAPNAGVVVSVLVEAENKAAKTLYEKCGFKVIKVVDKPEDFGNPKHNEGQDAGFVIMLEHHCRNNAIRIQEDADGRRDR